MNGVSSAGIDEASRSIGTNGMVNQYFPVLACFFFFVFFPLLIRIERKGIAHSLVETKERFTEWKDR